MPNVEIFDLIKYANENQPIDFAASLDKLLSQRSIEILAAKKQELAQSMFNDSADPDDETEDYDDEEYDEEELQQALDDIDAEEDFDLESTEEQEEDGESDD